MAGKRGLFIVSEGIDGSGKSTQAGMLVKWLRKKGKKVVFTREPYTKKLKDLLRTKKNQNWLELFTADRNIHLKKVVIPALKSGKTAICDRYYYSTLAYQIAPKEWKSYASHFIKPDLALIFDVPVEIGLRRTHGRDIKINQKASYFEKGKILEKVRKNYLKMPRMLKEVKIIDSVPSLEMVFENVKKIVNKRLK